MNETPIVSIDQKRKELSAKKKQFKPARPSNFTCDLEKNALFRTGEYGPVEVCSYVELTARTRNSSGQEWGVLIKWKDPDGTVHERAFPNSLIASSELLRTFSDLGVVLVGKDPVKHLQSYLLQTDVERRVTPVRSSGWHEGRSFVLPGTTFGDADVILQNSDAREIFATKGSLIEWQKHVAGLCIGNSRAVTAVALALSGPFFEILKHDSFGLHYVGDSSLGKSTVAASLPASVWGSPEFIQTWRATANSLEGQASQRSHTVLVLDELSQVSADEAGQTVYMLGAGCGKGRADVYGQARRPARWLLPFISSGEIDIQDHMSSVGRKSTAGQLVRILDIPADVGCNLGIFEVLPDGTATGADLSNAIRLGTAQYYGSAGPAIVTELLEHKDEWSELESVWNSATDNLLNSCEMEGIQGQVRRAAGHFAVAIVAGEFASLYGVTGWTPGETTAAVTTCFKSWLLKRGTGGAMEDRQIKSRIRRFIQELGDTSFPEVNTLTDGTDVDPGVKNEHRLPLRRAGYAKTLPEGKYWLVFQDYFREELCKGYSIRKVEKVLLDSGWLKPDNEGKTCPQHRVPGGRQRMYQLTPKVLSSEDA